MHRHRRIRTTTAAGAPARGPRPARREPGSASGRPAGAHRAAPRGAPEAARAGGDGAQPAADAPHHGYGAGAQETALTLTPLHPLRPHPLAPTKSDDATARRRRGAIVARSHPFGKSPSPRAPDPPLFPEWRRSRTPGRTAPQDAGIFIFFPEPVTFWAGNFHFLPGESTRSRPASSIPGWPGEP